MLTRMTTGVATAQVATKAASRYRPDIDGLRALAVGLVLLYHAFPTYVRGGFIGVDVFFVISGYLITGILLDRRMRGVSLPAFVADFYKHRIRRIFPALIVVLVACAIYGWFWLYPAEYQQLTKYIAGGAGFVENFVAWAEAGYFDTSADTKPLLHLWSLAIEEQFYIVWPLLIFFFGKLARGKQFRWLFSALAAASLIYCIWVTSADPSAAYYSPLARGWELAVGGLLASLKARGLSAKPGPASAAISAIALAIIPVSALFFITEAGFPGWQAIIPVAATAAIIWFGQHTWSNRRLLGWRPIVYVGLISYPLYLWHWVVLSFLRIQDPQPAGVLLIIALLVSFGLAAATYHLVEKPIKTLRLGRTSLALLVVMALILAFGVTANTIGLSGIKLTATQGKLSNAYNPEPAYRFHGCFLDSATQTSADFASKCDAARAGTPTLLLWGDSLSAQLYPGLAAKGSSLGYTIQQRTASSCPPALDNSYSDRGNCNEINAADRTFIEKTRPEAVIINARWPDEEKARDPQISDLTAFLKDNGVKHVQLIGPAPDWQPDLRAILLPMHFPGDTLPQRMTPPEPTWTATKQEDASLAALAKKLGAGYLSLVGTLCTGNECLIRVSNDIPAGLVASDHDHLTAQSSTYVLRNFSLAV